MALTKIKLDSMVTGTLPDANIPDDITITGLSGTNSGDQTTGISDGNILECNANVADNDFLRIDGTEVEGRTASEVLSDIGAQASGSYITGSGSLSAQDLTDIGNLSNTNSGDNAVNTNYSGLAVTTTSVTDGTNTFNKATDFVSAASGGTFAGDVTIDSGAANPKIRGVDDGNAWIDLEFRGDVNDLYLASSNAVGRANLFAYGANFSSTVSFGNLNIGNSSISQVAGDALTIQASGTTLDLKADYDSTNGSIRFYPTNNVLSLTLASDNTATFAGDVMIGSVTEGNAWHRYRFQTGGAIAQDGYCGIFPYVSAGDCILYAYDYTPNTGGSIPLYISATTTTFGGQVTANGIKFDANGEVLDDYEEGTWTPTIGSSGSTEGTWTSALGWYTKIGDMVTIWFGITGSGMYFSSERGYQAITNLPFTAANPTGSHTNAGSWSAHAVAESNAGCVYLTTTTAYLHAANTNVDTSGVAGIGASVSYRV
jgi:hypothetical protein